MYKVVVAGGRDFNDYELLEKELIAFLKGKRRSEVEIVSGVAKGADTLGLDFADKHCCKKAYFPAAWNRKPDGTYDKSAGHRRNAEMAKYADACIAFYDGSSKGTGGMIKLAERYGLDLKVVYYTRPRN